MPTRKNKTTVKSRKTSPAIPAPISASSGVLSRKQDFAFPARWKRTLRYVDTVTLTSTSGGQAYYQFKVNSLFDPDLSGTGHQPRAYDQLCAAAGPYRTYRVHSCSARIEAMPNPSHNWNLACGFADVSSLSAGISGKGIALSYAELPGWIGTNLTAGAVPSKSMIQKATMSQIHNVSPSAISVEDNYAAAYNADPVDLAYFNIIGNDISANTSSIDIGVFLEFDVTFEDPFMLAAS